MTLEELIYAQLVALDFYDTDGGLSYEQLVDKAKEAADAYRRINNK